MITLKQLRYAVAVEKTRHFKQAADQCAVSQSALSTAIADLETQLGAQLFERDNKRVLVTPLGQQVLDMARGIDLEVKGLYELCRSEKTPLSFPMTLGVIPTIGPYLLPKVLPSVRRQYPDFQLTIVEEQTHVLLDQVRRGDIDTAIVALPYKTEGLHAFTFWEEDFFAVVHQSDVLADEVAVSSDQLRASTLLLLREGHCLKAHALAACKLQATPSQAALAGTSLLTLVQMVAGRMGATLVPAMALEQLVNGSDEIRALPLSEPGPHRKIAFVTRLNYGGIRNIEELIRLFRSRLQAGDDSPG